MVSADRVQVILGGAINSALKSAERFGADLHFESDSKHFYDKNINTSGEEGDTDVDIVALFAGAHTSEMFEGLKEKMNVLSWPELRSDCKMWLQIKESEKREAFTTRNVEVGAQKWHFSIESARTDIDDILRIRDNVIAQYHSLLESRGKEKKEDDATVHLTRKYEKQLCQIESVLKTMKVSVDQGDDTRFDYIFTNAPNNEHNQAKFEANLKDGSVVIDGKYDVDIKIATESAIDQTESNESAKALLSQFSSKVIVVGGDACVSPNPMAAYGATLASEFAGMIVQLAIGHGHLNAILQELEENLYQNIYPDWVDEIQELKSMLTKYYGARAQAENYFQWVQTLICNLYSLPPMT